MPDSVKNRTFREAFNGNVRYEIPFFQRGYAWEQRQWDQLFLDLSEQVIEEVKSGRSLSEIEHFFGPVVVLEKTGGPAELKTFLVIDGQQRITTVYLLLAVIKQEIQSKIGSSVEAGSYAAQLGSIVANNVFSDDDYLKLKVFSSKCPSTNILSHDSRL